MSTSETNNMADTDRKIEIIDITPTWLQWGLLYARLAESGEARAVRPLRSDLLQALATVDAFKAIQNTLTDEQAAAFAKAFNQAVAGTGN